jgi:hypothetical protein
MRTVESTERETRESCTQRDTHSHTHIHRGSESWVQCSSAAHIELLFFFATTVELLVAELYFLFLC